MLVDALVEFSDPDFHGAVLSALVRAEVESHGIGHTRIGPVSVVAAAYEVPEDVGLEPGEGSERDRERGREFVEEESNVWRVMDCLREAYEKRVRAA